MDIDQEKVEKMVLALLHLTRRQGPIGIADLEGAFLNRWLKARWFSFLGRRRLRSHRFHLALRNFQEATNQEPDNLHTAIEIGWCLYKLKDYQAAVDQYQSALQIGRLRIGTCLPRIGLGRGSAYTGSG
jgi:tetratricopeptide (TPR) repeat protein